MSENISEIVRNKIERTDYGIVFSASDFPVEVTKQKSVNKVLENLTKAGEIRRLSKGRYYKTKMTEFGELMPSSYQIVKDLLEENGKLIGYITGYQIFNELGLTTQVSAILQLGTIKDKKSTKRGYYRIKFVKQWNTITKENIPLLQLLDCLRFFKNIPDTNPADNCKKLLGLLSKLSKIQRNKIKKLSLKYTPQTIALLGAMLEVLNPNEDVLILQTSLNYQTFYNLSIPQEVLPNQKMEYKMKLHENQPLFAQLLNFAANTLNIRPEFIEKDYWITRALQRMSQNINAEKVVFKGGTSLSKVLNNLLIP